MPAATPLCQGLFPSHSLWASVRRATLAAAQAVGAHGDQRLERRHVHRARIQRLIEAALPPLATRHEAQVGRRFDRRGGQGGIHEFKQGVASASQSRIHLMAEGSQRFQFGRSHIRSMRARAFSCLFHGTDTPL
jgi:hypothetical protein